MTIRFETLTRTIDAAPGETVAGKIRLANESGEDAEVTIRVIGFGPESVDSTSNGQTVHLPAGETLDVDIPIAVPGLLGIGQHAAAFEVRTGLQGSQPLLGSFTLSVPSVERILIETVPSTIRGKRRPKFILDLTNNEAQPVTFVVDGSAQKVRVRFERDSFQLAPGEHASTRAKVLGPRRLFGQPTQHNLLLSARGTASSTAITAPYVQRPLIASRLRSIVAAITVVALWAGGMVGLYRWDRSQQVGTSDQSSQTVDADGTVQESANPAEPGAEEANATDNTADNTTESNNSDTGDDNTAESTDSDNSAKSNNSESNNSNTGDNTTGDDPTSAETSKRAALSSPISTSVTGTLTLDTDSGDSSADVLDGVVIKLRELQLGEAAPDQSVPLGFAATRSASQPSKIWSARRSTSASELGRIRQTVPVTREGLPNGLGIWLFSEVQLQRTYELVFQKVGFQSQSFVIEPTDDGTLVEVDVNLVPGEGSIVGTLTGPPAGQRNAAISITDGTLEYSTTAASDTGTFEIEGLSTPAVYTLTASLPGYGTVVQQVLLDTGEKDKPTDVILRPGVATVRGQVFGPEGGVGGAAVTVSGRGEPRTTTTLTEGDVGAFSLSGFDIDDKNPQVATITVEQDGFNRESTTRVLDRSDVSRVNFLLTGDRLRLSGVVRNSGNDVPIAGASLQLATGDLTLTAQTSFGSDSGEFDVADLPPGDYVIAVAAYEYVTSYEFVTLVEGTPPDRLAVALQKKDPADLSNQLQGDLTVRVIDQEGATQGTREVTNAEVRLFNTASGAPVKFVASESSNEVRYTVPIGTYTVTVTHDDYNPAARREVTVGLSGQTIEVELDKKLKASARVIDSVSGLPLIGYELSVFREPDLAGESEKEITVTVNGLDGEWETDEALPVGSYRIETNLEGYRIRNDQVLDATLNGADRVFRFEIRASLTEKLVLNDIRADPYAKVSGRVFRPTVDSLGVVQFEPIDEPLLKVTMKCTGRSPGASSKEAAATLSDELIVSGSDRYDTFTFPRETFAEQQLDRANCTINAEAGPTYAAAAPISFSNLSVSNGSAYTDRIVNFALAKPLVNTFKGTTFWIDQRNGQSRPVGGVTLTSLGAGAIVDFKANISGPEQSELVPESSFALLETRGDSTTGVWQFNGPKNQVIGQTLYRVEAPSGEFANGTINVTVNGAGDRTVNAVSGVVVTGSDANGFNIQMLPPNPGTLSGTVKILSVDNNFQKVTVKGYEPTNNPVLVVAPATPTPDETATVSPGTFEFLSASAGTWTVDFTAPPNHEFLVAATSSTDVFVPPNKTNTPFTTKLVELGQIDLTLNSSVVGGSAPSLPTVSATEVVAGARVALAATPTVVGAAPGPYAVRGFPATVDDTGTATVYTTRNYDVTFEAAGFDHESAIVDFTDPTNTAANLANSIDVRFDMQAGTKVPVTVTMQPYGFIRGRIQGVRASGLTGLDITQAGGNAILDITYSTTAGGTFASSSISPTKPTGSDPGTFELTGPPGYYRLTVTHPEFETTPGFIPPDPVVGTLPSGDFRMVNVATKDTSGTPWKLEELRTDLELQVFDSLAKTVTMDANYTLTPTATGSALPIITGDCSGIAVDAACVIPGLGALQEYTLLIKNKVGAPASFPAMTTIVAPQNSSNAAKSVKVTAVLPPLDQNFTVQVVGQNSNGDPVAAPTVTVTSDFDASAFRIDVDDNTGVAVKPNLADGKFASPTSTVISVSQTDYLFAAVPSGPHTVTATQQPPGYRALGTNEALLTVPSTTPANFTYTAENVTLTAVLTDNLTGGDYPNLSWTLASGTEVYQSTDWNTKCGSIAPFPSACPSPAWSFDEAANRLTIAGVPPELEGGAGVETFTLTINDELHTTTVSPKFNIPVLGNNSDGTHNITVTTVADAARLIGSVTQFDSATGVPVSLPIGGSLTLRDSAGTLVPAVLPPSEVYTGNGLYQRTVTLGAASAFYLLVSNTGYVPLEKQQFMQPGSVTTLNVNINKVAMVTVIVARDTAGTSPVLSPPPGLDVYLTTINGRVTPIAVTISGATHSFEVPGNVEYRVQATASDYGEIFTDPMNGSFIPAIGQTTKKIVALPRLVLVTVSGPASATLTNSFGTTETSPGRFEFPPGTTGSTGAGTLQIQATGYRTRGGIPIADQLITNLAEQLLPTVTVSGTLTTSTGSQAAKDIAFRVTTPAIVVGGTTIAQAESLNGLTTLGNYTMADLNVGPNGEHRVWTVEFLAESPNSALEVLPTIDGTSATNITKNIVLI
ncbi:carboxypeptidase regulatory-like domain-containing protein [Ilumatobacter sp.]|uniref:carboxypeptidase regulatory-like domain-containing protein n=1 Tax=Ilumatobacter sp. TaxID=1967498 RepID=UPI00375290C0